jgi:hypothetical protein
VDELGFEGEIGVLVPPSPIIPGDPCRGTVSASGEISLESHADAAHIHAHGQLGLKTMSLEYHIRFSDGTSDTGTLNFVAERTEVGPELQRVSYYRKKALGETVADFALIL